MMETLDKHTYRHYASPKVDHPRGKRLPPSRFCQALIIGGLICFVAILATGLVIEHPWNPVYGSEVEAGTVREISSPEYPGSPVPEEQLSIASEDVPESLVVQEQEGQLHARSGKDARSYTEEQVAKHNNSARRYAEEDQMAERDAAVQEKWPPPFKLPKLPIPSDILDIPIKIPTHISDIIGDLPLPTIPTHISDIVDVLPTEPGDIISGIPIPTIPPAPPVPTLTLPIPVPIPTKIPGVPSDRPTHTDDTPFPVPTVLPPSKPRDPGDDFGLPHIIEIPHKILGLVHHTVAQLSNDQNLPRPIRDMLRLIQRIIERIAGGPAVPKPPKKPKPTISLPIPTDTKIPIPTLPIPTLPIPTLPEPTLPIPTLPEPTLVPPETTRTRPPPLFPPPRPTLTLPLRARKKARDVSSSSSGDAEKGPLTDGERKQLKDAVSDEIWGSVDWSNPILAPLTAAAALVAFESVYRVAEAFKGVGDEDARDRLLGLLVVVDDDDEGDEEAMA